MEWFSLINNRWSGPHTGFSCFLIVDTTIRVTQKAWAKCFGRNVPYIFCFTFTMRRSRSAWLLSNGTSTSCKNCSTSSFRFYRRRTKALAFFTRGEGGESRVPVSHAQGFDHRLALINSLLASSTSRSLVRRLVSSSTGRWSSALTKSGPNL